MAQVSRTACRLHQGAARQHRRDVPPVGEADLRIVEFECIEVDEPYGLADAIAARLEAAGLDVLYDDRPKVSPGVKFGDAELIGVPQIVIVGRGAADGEVELWDRRTGDRDVLPMDQALVRLTERP
ncbi:MAG: hypothetical protein J0I44_12645 [Microbacterium sp.]|nr:hypothetical protein [Microbacterium sp.]